jgi:hypothetical protein
MAEKLLSDVKFRATLLAHKAYDTDAIRNFVKQRICWANSFKGQPKADLQLQPMGIPQRISWSVSATASNGCAAQVHDMTDAQTTTRQHTSLQR